MASALPTVEIEPEEGWPRVNARELWSYRGLLFFLVWRDIKVRYAQTILGAGWAIIQPVLTMVIFTVIFGNFAKIPSDGIPYAVFSLSALVPWTYFATALTGASNSVVSNTNLITKVYFPRLVIPLSPVIAGLVDFAVALGILVVVMLSYHLIPATSALLVIPAVTAVMILTAVGVGCWTAALNIQYRDIKYVVPFLLQVWMYASPIVYPTSMVPERYRTLYALNPMVGVIEGFRNGLLGSAAVPWSTVAMSLVIGIALFISGTFYFRHVESVFADVA